MEAGTVGLAPALETASPRLQKLIRKNLDIQRLKENLEYLCKKYPEVILELFMMHGFPTETEEEAWMTLDFAKDLKWIHFPYINILRIYSTTEMASFAMKNGISYDAIVRSEDLAWHELPETLPFEKSFTLRYQTEFLNEYFLNKERLLHVLPLQVKRFTEEELIQKYDSYLPVDIYSFEDLLEFTGIREEEFGSMDSLEEAGMAVSNLSEKIRRDFPVPTPSQKALRILLLDLDLYFTHQTRMLYDLVDEPLGLIRLITHLHHEFGSKVNGRIAKSRIDFNSYDQLKKLLEEFDPDVIGIRVLTFYREFFHRTTAMIRSWGIEVPIIVGGPHVTTNYENVLQDESIDLAVLGEGEETFNELIGAFLENEGKLPDEEILKNIAGLAFIPHRGKMQKKYTPGIILWEAIDRELPGEPGGPLEPINQPDDLVYTLFTSGSTGIPKGVLVEHRNLIANLYAFYREFEVKSEDTGIQLSSYAFDIFAEEVYPLLLKGGRLVIPSRDDIMDPVRLSELIVRHGVTIVDTVPLLLNELNNLKPFTSVHTFISGGDTLKPAHVDNFSKIGQVYNTYGPTESTVCATYYKLPGDFGTSMRNIPIGKPIANYNVYILDENYRLLPVEVPGELYVAGIGVTRGYLNHPELTAAKFKRTVIGHWSFVTNSFFKTNDQCPMVNDRFYKTGDLARWMWDGNIEFLGRIDQQVKIRGYRIEPGEIENRLLQHRQIKEAAVVAVEMDQEEQNKCLSAYIVPQKELTTSELRAFLSKEVPDYMIPSYFVFLDKLPLTSHGKLDRKALPKPGTYTSKYYVVPQEPVEKILAEIWQEVLRINRVGVNDNFFENGGDSIKAIQISSRLRKAGLKMEIQDLFSHPTIRQLAKHVKETDRIISQGVVEGEVELTPIQQWFFQTPPHQWSHFNQTVMLYREEGFDEGSLEKVFTRIVEHHDALRMIYKRDSSSGKVHQVNRGIEEPLLHLETANLQDKSEAETRSGIETYVSRLQQSMDLEKGPLIKLGLFKTGSGDHLLIIIHHLVMDGVSWRILLEDLVNGLHMVRAGKPIILQEKTDSFQYWAHQLNAYAETREALQELEYWKEVEQTPVDPLPRDREVSEGKRTYQDSAVVMMELEETLTSQLLREVNRSYNTEVNDILLTALGLAIKEWANINRLVVNLEGHGRETIGGNADISRTIGWFTSQYPVILEVHHSRQLSRQIKVVKETLRKIPNKGIGYGLLRYLTPLEKKQGMTFLLQPEISFNYLGEFGQEDGQEERVFEISPLGTGDSISPTALQPYTLDINGFLVRNRLRMLFTYNKYEFKQDRLKQLADDFKQQLVKIIAHCRQQKERRLTPSDLTYNHLSIEMVEELEQQYLLEDIYPLSPMQQGFLYHSLHDSETQSYIDGSSYRIEGWFKPELMEKSFNTIIERCDIFRTVYRTDLADIPLQVVKQKGNIDYEYKDISQMPQEKKTSHLLAAKDEIRETTFDLLSDRPFMLLRIFKMSSNQYELIWHYHHILMDGWCLNILLKELLYIYGAYETGSSIQLGPLVPYKNYIKWLETQDREAAREYWRNYLDSYEEAVSLPGKKSFAGTASKSKIEDTVEFTLGPEIMGNLQEIAAGKNATLYNIIQTVWSLLLTRYNNTDSVVFGQVVSGRPEALEGVERMVGVFINTIPKRVTLHQEERVGQLIETIAADEVRSSAYHYYPLADILAASPLKTSTFDHIIVFENQYQMMEIQEESRNTGFRVTRSEGYNTTHYDLVAAFIYERGLKCIIQFNSSIYQKEMMVEVAKHFKHIISQIIEEPDRQMATFSMLTEEERYQLVVELNQTQAIYPRDKTIHQLFQKQVEKTPYHTTIIFGDVTFTYEYLDQCSNELAHFLVASHRVLLEEPVAIMMEPSILAVTGILGILKAGAVYLPINPGYPKERISYILADSTARILLTTTGLFEESKIGKGEDRKNLEIIFLDSTYFTGSHSHPLPLFPASHPLNLAYIIYTSGSTGYPKGVMVGHRNVVRLVNNTNYIQFREGDRILQTGALEFDASTFEIWSVLLNGLQLFMASKNQLLAPQKLRKIIETCGITIMWMTASYFNRMVDSEMEIFAGLHSLLVGGDTLSPTHINKTRNHFPRLNIINGYGPTENTTFSTIHPIQREYSSNIPIGRPIANSTTYIVDLNRQPVPIGVKGELWVSGDGVARGYLNNPELTAERFIINPFVSGKRIYRTGDLALWHKDGNIEFCGRMDHQVKIRGYRIEPGEIEMCLRQHPGIKDVVITTREDEKGDKYLCSYIIPCSPETSTTLNTSELKEFLSDKLPDYMTPAYFVQMAKIPLTLNGKIDWKALPDPRVNTAEEYAPPSDKTEEKLVELWADVLGMKKEMIGMGADFFELGGHSLKATTLVSKIHKSFEIEVPLPEVFSRPTIRELSAYIKEAKHSDYAAIKPVEKKEYYPLSSAQKRLYVIQQMVHTNTTYNMPYILPLSTEANVEKLQRTFSQLIQRHESLRTSFQIVNQEPMQKIHDKVEFRVEYREIDQQDRYPQPSGGSQRTAAGIFKHVLQPFDLSQAPLLRAILIKQPRTQQLLFLDMHHIITDGTSQAILQAELMALYSGEELHPLKFQYKDFSEWQNLEKQGERMKQQETYWINEFSGELPLLNLPTDYPRPRMQSFEGSFMDFVLNEKETRALKDMTKETNVTLYMSILSVFTVLLSRLSGQEDIIVGTPIASRRHMDIESVVGMVVNTLPIRNFPEGEKTFYEFLAEVKTRTLAVFENQEYQFEDLVENAAVRRDTGRNPIFDAMFNLLNESDYSGDISEVPEEPPYEHVPATSKFDLNLTAVELGDRLFFELEYCSKLFTPGTIDRIIGYFRKILSVLSEPGNRALKIAEIEIITEEEKAIILEMSNGMEEAVDEYQAVHHWFEEQAVKNPGNTALLWASRGYPFENARDSSLTYKELNRRANQLAGILRGKGVGRDTMVGLMLQRSFEMIIAVLAIMKAGGAYLPIDVQYPGERKKYMLEDSRLRLLVTTYEMGKKAPDIPLNVEIIDPTDKQIYTGPCKNPSHINKGSDLVYIIYTSGSTGKPKGVMLEHRNLINLLKFQFNYTNIDCSKILQFASISFDASFHEIFSALLSGGELYLIDKETRTNIRELFAIIEDNEILTLFLPMSFLRLIFNQEEYIQLIPGCIRHIQTAGEQVVIGNWLRRYLKEKKVYLHNHYGPSETHVVTTLTLDPAGDIPELPSIGKPILNTGIYILDKKNTLLPMGVVGELCIGGIQVGRGYLGKDDLTKRRFISNPFNPGEKIYKTGDLARWIPDRNVEFLGRIDHQVKIRGFRVEPGEIENQLMNHPSIKEVVVLTRKEENNDKYLCAYIVSSGKLTAVELREYLSQSLPDYMVPSYYVFLTQIPLTPNGKVDRGSLPVPQLKSGKEYIGPRGEIEKKLAAIWGEVLGIGKDKISIDDNFFVLGGHSLKATIALNKIHKEFEVDMNLGKIFELPTIRGLAQYIRNISGKRFVYINPTEKKEYYQLSSSQKRLYFIQQMNPDSIAYNIPDTEEINKNLEKEQLQRVFKRLLKRHDSFRTSFHTVGDNTVQRIKEDVPFILEYYELKGEEPAPTEIAGIVNGFVRPFQLEAAPLIRIGFIDTGEQRNILMMDMHHIISDGVSLEILADEFNRLLEGESLPYLKLQYKDFSAWQNRLLTSGELARQETYWLSEFEGEIPALDLLTDYERSTVGNFEGGMKGFGIGKRETALLKKIALEEGMTLFMMILAVYSIFLNKISNREDIIMGVPVAGRGHVDLEQIVGMFVNTLALRNFPHGDKTLSQFLGEVKTRTLQAFENQDYQFEDLVDKIGGKRGDGRQPLFDVIFTFDTSPESSENKSKEELRQQDLSLQEYRKRMLKFDMLLSGVDAGENIFFAFEYDKCLFKPSTIERYITYFNEILSFVINNRDIRLKDIPISHQLLKPQAEVLMEDAGDFEF